MCQLLGMNCNKPNDIVFSFTGFCQRGGNTDHHKDGWGIAFFEDKGVRVFLDCEPSVDSKLAAFINQYPIKSTNVVAHIRKATKGAITLANTHPFMRELWGHYWLFAHNGTLENLPDLPSDSLFQPVGTTDSEHAFCWVMNTLAHTFSKRPNNETLFSALTSTITELAHYGSFNFLLSDGSMMFAHCSTDLFYVTRQAPRHREHLADEEVSIDFDINTIQEKAAIITTQPLTQHETWTQMQTGEAILFVDGTPVFSSAGDRLQELSFRNP